MKKILIVTPIALAALLFQAVPAAAGTVEILDPWIRAVPPSSKATAAFMIIVNKGDKPVTLVSATSPISPDVRPMITTTSIVDGKEVSGMEFVKSFPIPAHDRRVLKPGADHIMIMQLASPPKAGDSVPMELTFETSGGAESIPIRVPVR